MLVLNEVDYERTHRISYLTSRLEHGVELPRVASDALAVVARYEESFEEVLDRAAVRAIVREWSLRLLDLPGGCDGVDEKD
jgi:hypothetical protein